jgi:putative addiction module killer protein
MIIMESQPREIQRYVTSEGKVPFAEWLDSLRDRKARLKIQTQLRRINLGNWGDYRSLGEGVYEFKINYGPGYRIYFGQVGLTLILLLCGGDKSTQQQDIEKAKEYWRNYYARR